MRRPNFFILGAPKCGTTSLAMWLSAHPQIFMPEMKEPNHFNSDFLYRETADKESYEALFRDVGSRHVAIGEASVRYLYSSSAVPNILEYRPDAQFIVCIRNPIEMVNSLYVQRVASLNEDAESITEAWRLQEERRRGCRIPRYCRDVELLQYGPVCKLGWQLERLFRRVDRSRCLVMSLDDLRQRPAYCYRRTLGFLGINDDGRTEFPVFNSAKANRSVLIRHSLRRLGEVRKTLNIPKTGMGIVRRLKAVNSKRIGPSCVPAQLGRELIAYYSEDVRLLSEVLDKDLSGEWPEFARADAEQAG